MKNYEYKIRSDLAIQNNGLKEINSYNDRGIIIKNFKDIEYRYTNIIFKNMEGAKEQELIKEIFKQNLEKYLKKYHIKRKDKVLIVGLGNKDISADSLGCRCADKIIATGHLQMFNSELRAVYVFIPNTVNKTGMKTTDSIKAIVGKLKPKLVIAIDALISNDIKYLNNLIQIMDRGIVPGSGVGNINEEISFKRLKIPVFSIGVPLGIDAATIIRDALNISDEKITFREGYDLIVAKKDVDLDIEILSNIISLGINEALNNFKCL